MSAPQRGVGNPTIKSTPLMVNGVLYFTIPDHAWALDARTGEEIWHYSWQDKGGHLVGNRGFGMYGEWLYLMTPDCWLISLNAKDGKERWKKKVADEKMQYFCTTSPLVVKNHIIAGVGGDAMDVPGFLDARDPETGDVQWRWNTDAPQRRARRRDLAQSASHGTRRRHAVDARHLRPGIESALLGNRQSQPGLRGAGKAGRQSLHRFHRGPQCRYRQTRLVSPALAARHPRLGQRRNPGPLRRPLQRTAPQDVGAGRAQRYLHRPRPDQRTRASSPKATSASTG